MIQNIIIGLLLLYAAWSTFTVYTLKSAVKKPATIDPMLIAALVAVAYVYWKQKDDV